MLARTIARPRATVARSTPPSAPQTTAAPAAAAPPAPAGPTVFFRGTAYNEAEWAAAVASGATAASAVTDDVVAVAAPSLTGESFFGALAVCDGGSGARPGGWRGRRPPLRRPLLDR